MKANVNKLTSKIFVLNNITIFYHSVIIKTSHGYFGNGMP